MLGNLSVYFLCNFHVSSAFFSSFEEGDRLSLQFRTSARNGLILHAESAHRKHELTVFIYEGKPRLRISGRCHWLYTRDVAFDDYNVSDNTFHTVRSFTVEG